MSRVIVLDSIAQEGLDLLEQAEGIEYEVITGLAGSELRDALNKFDAAICRSGVKITAEALEGNKRLRAIARAGVGTDNIDKVAATRTGIVVMNTPTGNTLSTAEHAFSLMLSLSRNIAPAHQSLCEGRWDRKKFMGSQLGGKTVGIVGLGRIGQEFAKRAQAFEMEVYAFDPFLSAEMAAQLGIQRVENVKDMLPKLDYLTVHTPLTPETRNLIDVEELELLKPGARLINCARGGIYNEAALVQGLESGQLGGVALDVFENEPCTDSPLFGKPGVLCTPHLGASTEEAQTQVAVEAVQLITRFLQSGEIRHAVNTAALDPATLKSLSGYLQVAYRLGLLAAQWHGGAIDRVNLSYRGEISSKDTKILTSSLCAGLLEGVVDDEANVINAEVLCKERGIRLSEERSAETTSFSSSMTVTVSGDGKDLAIGGTLFGSDMPRLFRLNEHRLEAYMDGNMLIFEHQDRPGVIGSLGSALGQHDINIAQMSVGRTLQEPDGKAIGVLNLDSNVPAAAIEEILKFDGIDAVNPINLPPSKGGPSWLVSN
ncbi:MAG: phosphoglycerate dehydrogenase [Planctomycetota bacterium]|jgi:D-3-phosphoglycerate dehydrogenase|nr:phosphoglycerate dehydrogenase [Planctomycetota bacterium]MEC7450493.1 phosphoglycerate dehydrogenase [Planctomycetota bacterium]MEC7717546.1 phosphoglycerate dehydrogenase [Planctomycetota bacterium]MEC8783011.1 phosphoglycerate dehydrogenase [Planctomycetota bacterium]